MAASTARQGTTGRSESAAPAGRAFVPRQLWEEIASFLRDDILGGALAPGTRLVETELADRFNVSRGPIREALRELERIGLVVDRPRRGVFVSTPSETDLEEITVLRESLETTAARVAAGKLLPEDVARLEDVLNEMEAAYAAHDKAKGLALDLEFHREFFVIAGNSRMLRAHDDLSAQLLLAWAHDHALREDVYPPARLHRGILEAIQAGDDERIAAAVAVHYAWREDRFLG